MMTMACLKALCLLVVIEVATLGLANGMGVVVSPTDASKRERGYTTIKCRVDMADVRQVSWERHGGDLPTRRHFIYPPHPGPVSYLLLYNLKASDEGMYSCIATDSNNMQAMATSMVHVVTEVPSPCSSKPCYNSGTCVAITQLNSLICLCPDGYTGPRCQQVVVPTTPPPPTTTPPPVTTADPCSSVTCLNGGTCLAQSEDSFICECMGSYRGSTCQTFDNCAINPCQNNGNCRNLVSSTNHSCGGDTAVFECACPRGFTGRTCAQRDFCSSSPCFNGATCVNVDENAYDCVCMDGYVGDRCEEMPFKGCGKYGQLMQPRELRDFFYTNTIRSSPPAADIVFVVDESRSMVTEHQWLQQVSSALDSSLQNNKIGMKIPNQFGLVGFARDNMMDETGRIIHMDNGCSFGQANDFRTATSSLDLNGRVEDMYMGIILALDHYSFRPGMACQIIGVTDEGRTPLNHSDMNNTPYEFDYVLRRLRESRCVLNVVVNQRMESGNKPALGVGSKGEGYVEVPCGDFRVEPGQGRAVADSGHGSTHKYYTLLAFASHGGAWDLNMLRQGGCTGMSFTKAFVHLKQREISRQLCERCECEQGPTAFCRAGCLGEPPAEVKVKSLYSQLSEAAVNVGGAALFECKADGDPRPTCSWTRADGTKLPESARPLGEGNCTLMLPDVSSITCVMCVAENIEGTTESSVQCIDYVAACELKDGRKILHGSSARQYSEIKAEDLRTIPFSSALVVMVVDESRSMIGEHSWLKMTLPAMEKNLRARGVGVKGRANQYALVGFASPRHGRLGRIVQAAPGRDCGSAEEIGQAMSQLRQDGRKEDGYAAIAMALDSLSCLQGKRSNTTALQVILVTDEDRDILKKDYGYEQVRQAIVRRGGILNVVVKNMFHGKDTNMHEVRAMGIDRRQRAVIVNPAKSDFYFLPHGTATKDTGHGTTTRDYVNLATHTGGGAWDLTMLRDGTYREAFTKGFIAAKVEEIQVQLLSRCEECFCSNGTRTCHVLSTVKTEEGCLNPVSNSQLSVSILGEASAAAGDFSKLECVVEGGSSGDEGKPAVVWDPHPVSALQYNNYLNNHHDLEFAVTLPQDAQQYRCEGRNEYGKATAMVELNVDPSPSNPFKGVVFGGSSGLFGAVVEETGPELTNTICVNTDHVRNDKIRGFSKLHPAPITDMEIRCEGRRSVFEFGYLSTLKQGELVFGSDLPAGVNRVGDVLKLEPEKLQQGTFTLSCREAGVEGSAVCGEDTACLKVLVMGQRIRVFPKDQVCKFL